MIVLYYEDRKCNPTKLAINNGAGQNIDGQCWWWLRSLGDGSYCAAYIRTYDSMQYYGNRVNDNNGSVRPALWINLKS